jgi:hypothetical protein
MIQYYTRYSLYADSNIYVYTNLLARRRRARQTALLRSIDNQRLGESDA